MPDHKQRKPTELPLTSKQCAFVEWYCSALVNMNGTEAARRAGYAGDATVLAQVASENLRKPHIRELVNAKLQIALSGAGVTVQTVLWKLQVITEKAIEDGQYSAAVKAVELQGKYLKMFSERVEHVQNLEEVSDEELHRLLGELIRANKIDIDQFLEGYAGSDRKDCVSPKKATPH